MIHITCYLYSLAQNLNKSDELFYEQTTSNDATIIFHLLLGYAV